MANITMDSLKKEGSVRFYPGMIEVSALSFQEENLDLSNLVLRFNGCYAANNSAICFVYDNEIFITPYTRSTLCLLLSAGFHRSYFYVPFSNGNYPKFEQSKWNQLLEEARLNPFTRN